MSDHDWRDTRVLVTGARGFIATHLCQRLVEAGAVVHGISSRSDSSPSAGMTWSRVDLTQPVAVRSLFDRVAPDVVFHLAGHVTGSQSLENVEPTFAANLGSTVQLLQAATETGRPRVVLAGSMQEPDPGDPTGVPCSPYAASKWACRGYAQMFHSLYHLPVVIARPMMVYGPGQWDDTKLLPYVTISLLNGTSPAISSGARELDWVFVDDVVDGLMTVAMSKGVDGQTIDLGSGTLTTIRTIVEHVVALVGSSAPVRFGAVADRPLERPRAARVEETHRLTRWRAATPLAEGLARTVAWYREKWSSPKPV